MKIGNRVITYKGEKGIIEKPYQGERYDWWVSIIFKVLGEEYDTLEPYRESELKLINSKENTLVNN